MTMTRGNWEPKTNYCVGKKYYQVARLYDIHQSGHYEFINAEFSTKNEAIAFANKLNEKGITDIAQATKMAEKSSEPENSSEPDMEYFKGGYLMENKKKAIVVSVMGRLVKRTASRHYWLYDGTKWVRLGLNRIADVLKISADVIKAAVFTATKKALASIATTEHDGSHTSILWFVSIGLTFVYCYLFYLLFHCG